MCLPMCMDLRRYTVIASPEEEPVLRRATLGLLHRATLGIRKGEPDGQHH